MKKLTAVVPAVAILMLTALASAGVVVDEQQTIDQPGGNKVTRPRTVMIEGNRQKSIIDNGVRSVITDLGNGTMTMVDGRRKTYVVFPFPSGQGMPAAQGGASPTISFKKTGGQDKIIGYACDEYSGAGIVGGNSVSVSGCFSDSAPGAKDYSNFQREMAEKVKGTSMANMGQIPAGVPLRLTVTTMLNSLSGAGASADQSGKLTPQFVTTTTVSTISMKDLPADTFQVPPGFHRQQQLPMFGGGAPMASPAPHKVPE